MAALQMLIFAEPEATTAAVAVVQPVPVPTAPLPLRAAPAYKPKKAPDLATRVASLAIGQRALVGNAGRDILEVERAETRFLVVCRTKHGEWWREQFHTAAGALRYAETELHSLRQDVA